MNSKFRRGLKNGNVLIGTLITMPVPEVAEIMIEVGFDWLFVDTEHAPFNAKDAQKFCRQPAIGAHVPFESRQTMRSG